MDIKKENTKATSVRCANFAMAIKKYQIATAGVKDVEVKAYYTSIIELCTKLLLIMDAQERAKTKLLIAQFIRITAESDLNQPKEFKALRENILEVRRVVQDQKARASNGPNRRR